MKEMNYESPEVTIIAVSVEGSLCISGEGVNPNYDGFNEEQEW